MGREIQMELTTLSYLDLIIQITIFGVLVIDYFFIQKKNRRQHGVLMTSAFISNTILIVAVMLPPFLGESTELFSNILEVESLLFLSHHVLGLVAELLGGFLVLRWVMKAFNTSVCKGKALMKATISTWLVSLILGIVLFMWHLIM
jgi:uncharacterized membrane protein YozB (DUF420 family)